MRGISERVRSQCRLIAESARVVTGAPRAILLLYDETTRRLVTVATPGSEIPLQVIAFATLAPELRPDATSLLSLLRNVGSAIVDFTALSDPVNVASRLQGQAAAGELLISEEVAHQNAATNEHQLLELRGRVEPISVYAVTV